MIFFLCFLTHCALKDLRLRTYGSIYTVNLYSIIIGGFRSCG
nr:MAG TPA: hypothetical protein [Caudoviricetes sp.]